MNPQPTTNRSTLRSRLDAAEALLKQAEEADLARRYAASLVREVVNPLEIINNLVYITRADPSDAARVSLYMDMIQDQLDQLNELTKRTLGLSVPPKT